MNKPKTISSLNQQIRQLQQQMADEQVIQQKQQSKVWELLVERLTSWPVLLGAVATGLLLSQTRRHHSTADTTSAVPNQTADATTSSVELTPAQLAAAAPEPAAPSFWSTLLSLPLLTQGIWWLAEQIWYSRLFRDVVRQKLLKSDQRHPPY